MRLAVIADAHANLPALQSVLQRIETIGVDSILCLGDTVGYNAQPAETLDLVLARCAHVLAGNHDVDIATGREIAGTSATARIVQEWTRDHLDSARLDALRNLPATLDAGDAFIARHGSFLGNDPTNGYVTSTMLDENLRAIRDAASASVAFCGHTHVPMIGWLADDVCFEPRVDGTEHCWPADVEAVLINPGAVGQPRDRNPRAAFAVVDLVRRSVAWHRAPYDIAGATHAIQRSNLPSTLVDRLVEGR
jgi:diadenosine tetraphosphatase ApaH/serine/threonine PP2A family protein phosphatase